MDKSTEILFALMRTIILEIDKDNDLRYELAEHVISSGRVIDLFTDEYDWPNKFDTGELNDFIELFKGEYPQVTISNNGHAMLLSRRLDILSLQIYW